MRFLINRDVLLKPLLQMASVIDKRQTLPILANVLMQIDASENQLTIVSTDLEMELSIKIFLEENISQGETITVAARKLTDICRSLPPNEDIEFKIEQSKVWVSCGRCRFSLSSLPAQDFPILKLKKMDIPFFLIESTLKRLLEQTAFAMAQQDVRYYLNGVLLNILGNKVTCVATDGHRLSLSTFETPIEDTIKNSDMSVIIPRKGVLALIGLLDDVESPLKITMNKQYLRIEREGLVFCSKLIEGKYPNYEQVIPNKSKISSVIDKQTFSQALSRVAVMSNEKYRGITISLKPSTMTVFANNNEYDTAEEEFEIDYGGQPIEVGFNAGYLLDILQVIEDPQIEFMLSDSTGSAVIQGTESNDAVFVIMPMRL